MFSRRRSRGHYDPKQYNAGISTPSASASAAANAFYMKQLGPSAAAEALRRHSLDSQGAAAVRDFAPGAAPPRGGRANSLTARSGFAPAPPAAAAASSPLSPRTPGYAASPRRTASLASSRRNSLSGGPPSGAGRANSLTRTQTTVNRDAQGRTLSLTTTTIRQMGSFELVSTKEVPIASPARLARPSLDYGSRTSSLKSMDSELVGIQEEPEEDPVLLARRLNRLGDFDEPIAEADEEEEEQQQQQEPADAFRLHDGQHHDDGAGSSAAPRATAASAAAVSDDPVSDDPVSDSTLSDGTVSEATASPVSPRVQPPQPALQEPFDAEASADKAQREQQTTPQSEPPQTTRPQTTQTTQTTPPNDERLPAPPAGFAPLHREVSPARSALKNAGRETKTKVSFGGADEPYVYESYEYDDAPAPSPGMAAATAAARRQQATQPHTQPPHSSAAAAAAAPASRRRLVLAQPPLNVEKRPSQTSLGGRTRRAAAPPPQSSTNTPYPHTRPWDLPSETWVDAPAAFNDLPVPARNAAREARGSIGSDARPVRSASSAGAGSASVHSVQSSVHSGHSAPSGASAASVHSPTGSVASPASGTGAAASSSEGSAPVDPIRAQALALAQSQFNAQQAQSPPASPEKTSHHYRSLVEDDAASVRSDSSFTRERRRGGSRAGGPPSRMRSLRQPATPTLRTNNSAKKGGRTGSLLNQQRPDLGFGPQAQQAASPAPAAAAAAGGGFGGGLRTFSLRNQARPDAAALGGEPLHRGPSNDFRSRIADSDSDDEGGAHRLGGGGGGRSGGRSKRKGANGKISLGDMFSPNTDVKDLFKPRATSDGSAPVEPVTKPKKRGGSAFFRRVFGKKEVID